MSEDELNKKVDITLKELLTIIKFEMLKEPSAIVHRPNLPEQIVTNAYIERVSRSLCKLESLSV